MIGPVLIEAQDEQGQRLDAVLYPPDVPIPSRSSYRTAADQERVKAAIDALLRGEGWRGYDRGQAWP